MDLNRDWVIETQGLTKVYQMGATELKALQGVDVTIERGGFVALMGTSGSGKSTLLHLLGCLDTPTSGVYTLDGQDVSSLSNYERAKIRNRDQSVVIRGDRNVKWEHVAAVMGCCGQVGITKVAATVEITQTD